jgi:hypothetical protein
MGPLHRPIEPSKLYFSTLDEPRGIHTALGVHTGCVRGPITLDGMEVEVCFRTLIWLVNSFD